MVRKTFVVIAVAIGVCIAAPIDAFSAGLGGRSILREQQTKRT